MIIEWLVQAGSTLITWVIQLFPQIPAQQIIDTQGNFTGLGSIVGSMSVWVNWVALAAQISFVLGLYFTFLTFRIVRALIGHVPMIGGNG